MTGYTPYWIFMPKYLEIIYKQSASTANLITGKTKQLFIYLINMYHIVEFYVLIYTIELNFNENK